MTGKHKATEEVALPRTAEDVKADLAERSAEARALRRGLNHPKCDDKHPCDRVCKPLLGVHRNMNRLLNELDYLTMLEASK